MPVLRSSVSLVLAAAATLSVAAHAVTPSGPTPSTAAPADQVPRGDRAGQDAEEIVARLLEDGDFDRAEADLRALLDGLIAWVEPDHPTAWREVVFARRIVGLAAAMEGEDRIALLRYLTTVPRTARRLAFLMRAGQDDPYGVGWVLAQLAERAGTDVDRFPDLAAALCVVHDVRHRQRLNENIVSSPGPVALMEYFVRNDQRMVSRMNQTPAELLVHVVDATCSIADLEWALGRYPGQTNIESRYNEVPYDTDHADRNATKMVTRLGLTLPNVRKYGGVCVDQAWFANSVGKAIGIPTVYLTGRAAGAGHAWVGFLENRGGRIDWDFDAGRFGDYEDVRGYVVDPQTGEDVPDSHVMTLVATTRASIAAREQAVALVDAADRIHEIRTGTRRDDASISTAGAQRRRAYDPRVRRGDPDDAAKEPKPVDRTWPPEAAPFTDEGESNVSPLTVEDELALLRRGVEACPTHLAPWRRVQQLAAAGDMDFDQRRIWADATWKLCGSQWAELYIDIVEPMVATVDDPRVAGRVRETMLERVKHRIDLAASLLIAQGDAWARAGSPADAITWYERCIREYRGAAEVATAVEHGAEQVEAQRGPRAAADWQMSVWRRIDRPDGDLNMRFFRSAPWVQVGRSLEQRLRALGRSRDADAVRTQIVNAVR